MKTAEIWRKHQPWMKAMLISKTKNESLADDILQNVFITVHQKIDTLKDPNKIKPWLFRIAQNELNQYYREKTNDLNSTDILEADSTDSSEPIDLQPCLNTFITELPNNYKELIEYDLRGEGSLKKLAMLKNTPYSTIKSRYQRAKSMLKGLIIACCRPITDKYGNIVSAEHCEGLCSCAT